MNLTREQAIIEHRKMWNWIADETLKRERKVDKEDYFREHREYSQIPIHFCWCCEYCEYIEMRFCNECIIDWGFERCTNTHSSYRNWRQCDNYDYIEAAKYAKQIAELPERQDNK